MMKSALLHIAVNADILPHTSKVLKLDIGMPKFRSDWTCHIKPVDVQPYAHDKYRHILIISNMSNFPGELAGSSRSNNRFYICHLRAQVTYIPNQRCSTQVAINSHRISLSCAHLNHFFPSSATGELSSAAAVFFVGRHFSNQLRRGPPSGQFTVTGLLDGSFFSISGVRRSLVSFISLERRRGSRKGSGARTLVLWRRVSWSWIVACLVGRVGRCSIL